MARHPKHCTLAPMLASPDEHWLFVCAANLARSPSAEYVARKRGLLATSCGTSRRFGEGVYCVPINAELIFWATIIVCMEPKQVARVREIFPQAREKPVKCWHIADEYRVYQPELLELCEARLDATLKEMGW